MGGVAVVTDSGGSLPLELARRLGIEVVSLYYELGGTGVRRELDLDEDYGGFYKELVASDEVATSSAASVEDLVAVYERLLKSHDSVVAVHVSSAVSETCPNARQAAARLNGDRVMVIDSAGVAAQQALQALAAGRAAAAGEDAAGVIARAHQARQEVKMWGFAETLEYLRRGVGSARPRCGWGPRWTSSRSSRLSQSSRWSIASARVDAGLSA
jgi:DegV family protein with EDD domain